MALYFYSFENRTCIRFLAFTVLLAAAFTTGCGSSSQPKPPVFSGNTSVTLMLSSTANSQLSQFNLGFNSIALTNQSGATVSLFSSATSQNAEFLHLNGGTEPMVTVSIPQGIYTAATASVGPANFTCVTLASSGGLDTSTYAYGTTPAAQVTVNLPKSITVTGTAMGLSLDMLVSQSASFPSACAPSGVSTFSITPTFNLSAVPFSSQPVKETGLKGQIASVSPADDSFALALANGETLTIKTNSGTVYQGVNGFSLLSAGEFADMDATIQSDGSQLATRIAVDDTNTSNLSVAAGPALQTNTIQPIMWAFGRQEQGYLIANHLDPVAAPYSFGSAAFQISGQFANLQTLPFPTTFNAANLFPGQNIYVSTHATFLVGNPTYFPATTVTLIPQTINGTIIGSSSIGSFTTYTVALPAYDLIPKLSVQAGQTTVLTNPNNVVVYVDGSTQMLNTQPPAAGSVLRFYGMLFNDNGTLRMDCGQVNDGVAE